MKNVKIGILTHFSVCNFGANIQALSTYGYLKQRGFEPIFINWDIYHAKIFENVPHCQKVAHERFVAEFLTVSEPLKTIEEIREFLCVNNINNIIVGSDAVFSLSTWFDRFAINRKGITLKDVSLDKLFPNPFWLPFAVGNVEMKCIAMSPSCQNAVYQLFSKKRKAKLKECLMRFDYLSARDLWTAKMIKSLSGKKVEITPDPVWGFNYNFIQTIDKSNFLNRYSITSPYILLGFQNAFMDKTPNWIEAFINLAHKKGYICVSLPFPFDSYKSDKFDLNIELPLPPLDWYNLIRYSSGYVGYNMHPIIVSLHNNIPFFSVDNYGVNILKLWNIESSSKIYDILKCVDLNQNRMTIRKFFSVNPKFVLDAILKHDYNKGKLIALKQYDKYLEMMNCIVNRINYEI